MENCGYSSPRSVAFPAGLRVLVVDDDPTWLKILEKMLIKCLYEVTTCGLAREALSLLRERKDGFDIVISDVNMPDMDGFKLLEHVGLEMDLPVIMMSVDGETSRVMKGVQHGACDYLLKPIRMKELRNIWQHVLRKRIHEIKDIENHDGNGHMEDRYFCSGTTDLTCVKKRKDLENKHDDIECNDYLSVKKTRVIWTVDLHQKFVKAVHLVGLDKVGPKKILDLMNIPWLTRENVASHLQKYRLYLSRLQKEKELKSSSFSRMKHRDFFYPKEHIVNQNLQKLTTMQQKESKNIDFKFLEGKAIGDDPKRENLDPQENSSSRMTFKNPFDSEVKTIGNAENNQHFLQSFNLVNLPTFQQKNNKTECLQPVFCPESRSHSIERQIIAEEEVNPPASFNSRTRNDLYSILPNTELLTIENTFKPNIIKSQRHDQIPVLDPRGKLSTMTDFASWCENQRVCSFDGDLMHSLESLGSTGDSEHGPEAPSCWMYDSLRFDSEYPSDTMELSMVDNGLFII